MSNVLAEWIKNYLKYRDLAVQDIVDFQENKDGYSFIVKRKREDQFIIISEKLSLSDVKGRV